jgi:hypothetical protein
MVSGRIMALDCRQSARGRGAVGPLRYTAQPLLTL